MQKWLAILLCVVINVGLIYQTSYYAWFIANRAEITELFCINKDKPELKCNGQCHLKTELTKTDSKDEPVVTLTIKMPEWTKELHITDHSIVHTEVINHQSRFFSFYKSISQNTLEAPPKQWV